MNIKALGNLLKDLILLEETKEFKLGEILKGEILENLENFLIIKTAKKGILKAYTKVPIKSKKILLKVIENKPKPVLKIIHEVKDEENFNRIENSVKKFHLNYDKVRNFAKKNLQNLLISEKNLIENPKILKKIIEQFGISHENKILKNEFSENLKSISMLKHEHQITQLIESFQFASNENFLFFPVFFKENEIINKAIIGFKKNKIGKDKNEFSILIFLDFPENEKLKIFVQQILNSLYISFSSNSEIFLKKIEKNFKDLKRRIENLTEFKVKSINFSLEEEINEIIDFSEFSQQNSVNLKA